MKLVWDVIWPLINVLRDICLSSAQFTYVLLSQCNWLLLTTVYVEHFREHKKIIKISVIKNSPICTLSNCDYCKFHNKQLRLIIITKWVGLLHCSLQLFELKIIILYFEWNFQSISSNISTGEIGRCRKRHHSAVIVIK